MPHCHRAEIARRDHNAGQAFDARRHAMWITFMLSGGFAGQVRGCRIDTQTLAAGDRAALEALVIASGLVASFERFAAAARDRPQYDLAIERAEAFVRVSCDDASLPEPARPLVADLVGRSTPQPLTFAVPEAREHAAADRPSAEKALPGRCPPGRSVETPEGATVGRPRDSFGQPGSTACWGRFVGDVVAKWDANGRDMTLVEPFGYVDPRDVRWEAPAASVVNGASIPRAFWSLIGGPFEGRFRNASVVHDVACVDRGRRWQDVHRMFHDACRCGGVGSAQASAMYYAVYHFGPRWTVEERRTVVGGAARVDRVVRDDTPPPPTAADVTAVERYFAAHDVPADAVPTLAIPGVRP
ncbi:MAG: protealysin inhibitor emfourin [Planctomycetaceae bacterium]